MSARFVYVWDFKGRVLPKTIKEVAEQASVLYRQHEEASDSLLSFAHQLQEYANQHLDDEDIQECFGDIVADLQIDNSAALRLELPVAWESPLRTIVEAAQNKSLIVYDEDGGMAFLAHGKMLPRFMEKEWAKLITQQDEEEKQRSASPNLPRTEKQFEAWAGAIVREGLSKHGFIELDKSSLDDSLGVRPEPWERLYQRDVVIGQQYLVIAYCGKFPNFSCTTSFFMKCPVVYQYVTEIERRFTLKLAFGSIFGAYLHNITGSIGSLDMEESDLGRSDSAVWQFVSFLEKKLLPLLDIATDLEGLDSLMNGNINDMFKKEISGNPSRLIIASLVKNPNFDALVAESEKSMLWKNRVFHGKQLELEGMVNYIRTEVKG
ncbi:MAG: hypothetical protein Q7U16_18075 [Agitococcus sp.]|nr:hypothetical protein [Agitococcus sp.]